MMSDVTAILDSDALPALRRTRNTQQRQAVLQAVQSLAGQHPTAAEVFQQVRLTHSQMSLATVYRALHALVEQQKMSEMRVENVSRFDAGPTLHHHLVCRRCGQVTDIDPDDTSATLLQSLTASCTETGFRLDPHPIQFTGVCAACRARG